MTVCLPDESVSDAECAIHLDDLYELVRGAKSVSESLPHTKDKTLYRTSIDGIVD